MRLSSICFYRRDPGGLYHNDSHQLRRPEYRKDGTRCPGQPGGFFPVGTTLIEHDSGVKILVLPYQWPALNWTDNGFVEIVPGTKAGGSGNEVHFDNACLGLITPKNAAIKELSVKIGEYGGNVNLIENGAIHNYDDYSQIPSPTPSGLTVTVTGTPPKGVLQLKGQMAKFYYMFPVPPGFPILEYSAVIGGGQELWIDDISFVQ